MNKTLRWLIATVLASLISYTLFAALGLYIGNANYDHSADYPSIAINFVPISGTKQPQNPIPRELPPTNSHHANTYQEPSYKSVPNVVPATAETVSIAEPAANYNKRRATVGLHPTFKVEPIYPMFAIARGLEGWVEIEFLITENGAVIKPQVIASEPPEVFEQTALTALSQWRYLPGNKGKSSVYIKFELHDN